MKKSRPKVGDRKMIRGILHERRQVMVREYPNEKLMGLRNNGRPVCEWIPVHG